MEKPCVEASETHGAWRLPQPKHSGDSSRVPVKEVLLAGLPLTSLMLYRMVLGLSMGWCAIAPILPHLPLLLLEGSAQGSTMTDSGQSGSMPKGCP